MTTADNNLNVLKALLADKDRPTRPSGYDPRKPRLRAAAAEHRRTGGGTESGEAPTRS